MYFDSKWLMLGLLLQPWNAHAMLKKPKSSSFRLFTQNKPGGLASLSLHRPDLARAPRSQASLNFSLKTSSRGSEKSYHSQAPKKLTALPNAPTISRAQNRQSSVRVSQPSQSRGWSWYGILVALGIVSTQASDKVIVEELDNVLETVDAREQLLDPVLIKKLIFILDLRKSAEEFDYCIKALIKKCTALAADDLLDELFHNLSKCKTRKNFIEGLLRNFDCFKNTNQEYTLGLLLLHVTENGLSSEYGFRFIEYVKSNFVEIIHKQKSGDWFEFRFRLAVLTGLSFIGADKWVAENLDQLLHSAKGKKFIKGIFSLKREGGSHLILQILENKSALFGKNIPEDFFCDLERSMFSFLPTSLEKRFYETFIENYQYFDQAQAYHLIEKLINYAIEYPDHFPAVMEPFKKYVQTQLIDSIVAGNNLKLISLARHLGDNHTAITTWFGNEKWIENNIAQLTHSMIGRALIERLFTATDGSYNKTDISKYLPTLVEQTIPLLTQLDEAFIVMVIRAVSKNLGLASLQESLYQALLKNYNYFDRIKAYEVIAHSADYVLNCQTMPEEVKAWFKEYLLNNFGNILHHGGKSADLLLKNAAVRNEIYLKLFQDESYFFDLSTIKKIAPYTLCNQKLQQIVEGSKSSEISKIVAFLNLNQCEDTDQNRIKKSLGQTASHLTHHVKKTLHDTVMDSYLKNSELLLLANTIIAKEQELGAQGYYTFVHGQKREFYLMQKLYTLLWEITQEKVAHDYVFPYFKPLATDQKALALESEKRIRLLNSYEPKENTKNCLFMNYGLFGNTNNLGSNTAYYIATNSNAHAISFSFEQIFTLLKAQEYYNQFAPELEQLQKEYTYLSRYGNALVIAIPKQSINEYVYPATVGGVRVTPFDLSDHTKPVHTMHALMEKLTTTKKNNTIYYKYGSLRDSDALEFCMPMTFDKALNPESGIKIIPFVTGPTHKLQELQAREKDLFDRIRAAIQIPKK